MYQVTLHIPDFWDPQVGQTFAISHCGDGLITHVEPGLIRLLVDGDGPDRVGVAGYVHKPGCTEETA